MSIEQQIRERAMQEMIACEILTTVVGISREAAQDLLNKFGGMHKLAQSSESAVMLVPGIGKRRAAKLRALTEWALLLQQSEFAHRTQIRAPHDIANLLMLEMSLLEREELRVIVLDTKNRVRSIEVIYQGSVNAAVVRVSEIFRPAIAHNATSIVLVHNHPSGDPTPSPEDVRLTQVIYATGKDLDIDVLDHVVIGGNRYVSLKERSLGFEYQKGYGS